MTARFDHFVSQAVPLKLHHPGLGAHEARLLEGGGPHMRTNSTSPSELAQPLAQNVFLEQTPMHASKRFFRGDLSARPLGVQSGHMKLMHPGLAPTELS